MGGHQGQHDPHPQRGHQHPVRRARGRDGHLELCHLIHHLPDHPVLPASLQRRSVQTCRVLHQDVSHRQFHRQQAGAGCGGGDQVGVFFLNIIETVTSSQIHNTLFSFSYMLRFQILETDT